MSISEKSVQELIALRSRYGTQLLNLAQTTDVNDEAQWMEARNLMIAIKAITDLINTTTTSN
jgi:hypothetical protein